MIFFLVCKKLMKNRNTYQCQVAFLGLIFSRQTMHSICPETSCWVRRSLKLRSDFDFFAAVFDLKKFLKHTFKNCKQAIKSKHYNIEKQTEIDYAFTYLLLLTVCKADRASWPCGFPCKNKKKIY